MGAGPLIASSMDVEETKSVCDLAIEESDLERENEATLATLERS
jgi:hypothetical protein